MHRLWAFAINLHVDWSCTFTIISLCLAILYSLLLFVCLFYSIRLLRLPCHKRQSQRVFLTLVALQCILRALYFFLWPLLMADNASQHCIISVEGEHESVMMLITGSLPSALLLSAFTINAFTFARIYHTTLNHSILKYRLVLSAMALINVVTYTALALLYLASLYNPKTPLSDQAEEMYLYALSCSFFVIAASFSYYGIKLWLGVRSPSLRYKDTSSPSFSAVDPHYPNHNAPAGSSSAYSTPFLTPSSSFASSTTALPTASSSSWWSCGLCGIRRSYHPMLKLAIISTLCMLCFVVRVVLLPLLSHYTEGEFSFPLLLLYLCLSEVLPLLLVLYLFDPMREGKGVLRGSEARNGGNGGGFGHTDDDYDEWRVDDEGEYGAPGSGGVDGHAYDRGGGASPRSVGSVVGSVPSQYGSTPFGAASSSSYVDLSLPSSLPTSLSSVGREAHLLPTLSPRELDRRRARTGMSYETAFKQDLKSLIADD